jgi:hypothetical protein
MLLSYFLRINFKEDSSALHVACWCNQIEIIEELIEWGHPLEVMDNVCSSKAVLYDDYPRLVPHRYIIVFGKIISH